MKKFICIWGSGYCDDEATIEYHSMDFFSDQHGYDDADRKAIDSLCLGRAYEVPNPEVHTIVRIS